MSCSFNITSSSPLRGHGDVAIKQCTLEPLNKFEHVIASTSIVPAVELSGDMVGSGWVPPSVTCPWMRLALEHKRNQLSVVEFINKLSAHVFQTHSFLRADIISTVCLVHYKEISFVIHLHYVLRKGYNILISFIYCIPFFYTGCVFTIYISCLTVQATLMQNIRVIYRDRNKYCCGYLNNIIGSIQ